MPKIKKEQYLEALRQCDGIKSRAAKLLGVSPARLTQVCNKWPELQEFVDSKVDELLDNSQYGLSILVKSLNLEAIKVVHRYYGHRRGLVPVGDMTSGGRPLIPPDSGEKPRPIEPAIAVLLHSPAALGLLNQFYLELKKDDNRRQIVDAEFSSKGSLPADSEEQ